MGMSNFFKAIHNPCISWCWNYTCNLQFVAIVFTFFSTFQSLAQDFKNQAELKKTAASHFAKREYNEAGKQYSQLLSIYPKELEFNFKYGACLIFTDQDKSKPLKYLEFAAAREGVDPEALYFYAKALHLNYKFNEAIDYYKRFMAKGSSKSKAEFKPEREIESCNNGKKLIRNISSLHVMDKKEVRADDFFRFYDLGEFGGKIIVKPDDFTSPIDSKKGNRFLMFQPTQANELYFSSFGENDKNGKDIFFVKKLPNGDWSKPQSLGSIINTPYDEDYPFLHPNGNVLYFSSKGHNSMGGYDIFKSLRDTKTGLWGPPENLDFAINSPDDDIFYITNKDETIGCFSSSRASRIGYTNIYKIDIEARPEEFLLVSGKVIAEFAEFLQSGVNIRVEDSADNNLLGVFTANSNDGKYLIKVPNGGNIKVTVEVKNHTPRSETINIPLYNDKRMLKQEISLFGKGANYNVVFKNLFEDDSSEEETLLALDIVKQQANLNINYSESRASRFKRDYKLPEVVSPTGSDMHNKISASTPPTGKITNDQIVNIARDDANAIQREADELKNEATFAFTFAAEKADFAEKKHSAFKSAKDALGKIADTDLRQAEAAKVNQMGREAERSAKDASIAYNLAERLESQAKKKKQEADQANKYVNDLENAVNSSSTEALKKLESQRDQLLNASSDKTSEEVANDYKKRYQDKQREAGKARAYADEAADEVNNFNIDIKNLEKETATTKDKNKKQDINDRITTLKADREDAIANQNKLQSKATLLEYDADQLKNDIDLIESLQNEFALLDNSKELASLDPSQKNLLKNKISTINNVTATSVGEVATVGSTSTQLASKTNSIEKDSNKEIASKTEKETVNKIDSYSNLSNSDERSFLPNEEINIFNEKGEVINYSLAYDIKLAEAENLNNEIEKFLKKSDVSEAWANSLGKEIAHRKSNVSKISKDLRADEEKKITSLELLAKQKRRYSEALFAKALAAPGEMPLIQNKTVFVNEEVNIFNPNGELSDYGNIYQQRLDATDKIDSPYQQKVKQSEILEAWSASLEKEAAYRQDNLTKLNKPLQVEEQRKIDLLKQDALTKHSESEKTYLVAKSASEMDIYAAKKENAELNYTSQSTRKHFEGVADFVEVVEVTDQQGQFVNYSSIYQNQLSKTELLSTDYEKERSKGEILSNWSASSGREIALRKQSLSKLKGSARKAEENKIEELKAIALSKQIEANTHLKKAESLKLADNLLANSGTTEILDTEKNLNLSGEDDMNGSGKPLYGANNFYNSKEANIKYEEAKSKRNESLKLKKEANQLRSEVSSKSSEEEKRALLTKANDKDEEASKIQIISSSLFSEANNIELNSNNKVIEKSLKKASSGSKTDTAELLYDESVYLQAQALKQKSIAELQEDGTLAKLSKLEKAIEIENQALAKQKESMQLLGAFPEGDDSSATVFDKSVDSQNNSMTNLQKTSQSSTSTISGLDDNSEKSSNNEFIDTIVNGNSNSSETTDATIFSNYQQVKSESAISLQEADNARSDAAARQKEADDLNQFALSIETEAASESSPARKQQLLDESNELKKLAEQKETEVLNSLKIASNYDTESASRQIESDQFLNEFDKNNYEGTTDQKSTANVNKTELSSVDIAPSNTSKIGTAARFEPPKVLTNEIFEKTAVTPYSTSNPIPVDAPLPEGLIFKVQVGAFRNPIPQDLFKGFSPITGETTPQGLIRYTAGYFKSFNTANLAKEVIRESGYRDAFVVAFYNGKRISINEANALIRDRKVPAPISGEKTTSLAIQSNQNVQMPPVQNIISNREYLGINPADFPPGIAPYKELEAVKGLFYTVQVGVYTKPVPATQLFNIQPLNAERTPNGLLRYSSGIYNNTARANEARKAIVNFGVKDAFITAYYDGKRITIAEAKAIETSNGNAVFVNAAGVNQMPYTSTSTSLSQSTISIVNETSKSQTIISNENNIKTQTSSSTSETSKSTSANLIYKVQIGAFKEEVPVEIASIFFQIATKGISHYKNDEGLTIYNTGNFGNYDDALKFKKELSVEFGLSDCFVVPYFNNKRIPLNEALEMK
jgi:hypothetical protein